ncbi:MAG: prolipoprotein diacylglyceryl transferase [Bacteroidales bacterium]|nr:prolipoprotein diacylglyceryl transferase [Bacteroidales bacterium]
MKIEVADPGMWFAFFYVLSFAVTFVLIVVFSLRKRIPLLPVLLLLISASFFTIAGSRLCTVPVGEWFNVIDGSAIHYNGRHAIGGLAAGFAALFLTTEFLKTGRESLVLYAWITPAGFGIQKAGCLLNGCCFGKVTDLPWGICYPAGTGAHYSHFAQGLISGPDDLSLAVHPVQLYEMIIYFSIAFIVWRASSRFKKDWSAVLFALSLSLSARFLVEFLRYHDGSGPGMKLIAGISMLQLALLTAAAASFVSMLVLESRPVRKVYVAESADPPLRNSFILVIGLSVLIFVFRGLFTSYEMLALNIRFVPAILLTAFYVFASLRTTGYRLATTSSMAVPLFLVFHAFSPDTVKKESVKDFYGRVGSYKSVDFSISEGDFYSTLMYDPHEGQCGTAYTHEDYRHLYRMAGGGFSVVKKDESSVTTGGIVLYGGVSRETNISKQWEKDNLLIGVNPSVRYDTRWYGVGVGAHFGNIRWAALSPVDKTSFDRGTRYSPVMPEAYLRVGVRDIFDIQYNYGFNRPVSIPVLMHELSIGSGLGVAEAYSLRLGAALSEQYSCLFLSGEALLGTRTGIYAKLYFGGDDFYFSWPSTDLIGRTARLNLGLSYRFGFK